MLSYVTVGTNDYDRALSFYDGLFSKLGGSRVFEAPNGQFYGFGEGTLFCVLTPADEMPASNGNGTMFAFKVSSPAEVNEVYEFALELGAADEGKPGPRGERGFYAGYFRDHDGNKICVYHM